MARIFVVGSSVTFGAHVGASEAWVGRLRDELEVPDFGPQKNCDVYNFATAGQSLEESIGVVRSLRNFLFRRHNFLIAEAGLIDANARPGPEDFQSSPEAFAGRLERMHKLATSRAGGFSGLFLVTPTPVASVEQQYFKGAYFSEERAERFAEEVREYGNSHGIPVVDAHSVVAEEPAWQTELMADVVHPNAIGHAVIYAAARDVILPALEKARQAA